MIFLKTHYISTYELIKEFLIKPTKNQSKLRYSNTILNKLYLGRRKYYIEDHFTTYESEVESLSYTKTLFLNEWLGISLSNFYQPSHA